MQSINESFLSIVRLGIGHSAIFPTRVDWKALEALASEQGLSAIVLDGIEKLPDRIRPPQAFLLQWIGEMLSNYENNYVAYEKSIGRLARFYNSHGFRMMVMKGYGLSLNYPKPSHRPCGDIDIWQFGQQKEADEALEASFKVKDPSFKVDKSHHHHTVFEWQGFTVENHFDWVNVYGHRSSMELERIFKELAKDDSHWVKVNGEKVYLPSPNLHALFLMKHTMLHFVATSMSFRQLLDWAFFAEKHREEIDWKWLEAVLEKYHMKNFYNCVNAICVEELGFEPKIFGQVQFISSMKDNVLEDTLSPKFTENVPKEVINRVVFKYRRWKANSWKRRMCYEGSDAGMFIRSAWAHIVKPAHI